MVSSGNEAVVTAAEFLDYLVDDPHTEMIGGFIETIRGPNRFAAEQLGNRLPIVTHTGGPADDPQAVSELLRAHRAIEVADLVELTELLAALQGGKRPAGPRIGVITSSGGLAELILDVAASAGLQLPPLSVAAKAEIIAGIGFITGDGNPLDAWGSGTFAANLPKALRLFDASPDHDAIVFCRDNYDDQPFDMPETARTYLDLFVRSAEQSRKPHYLLNTRPGIMDWALVAYLREHRVAVVGGIREGLSAIDRLARNAG